MTVMLNATITTANTAAVTTAVQTGNGGLLSATIQLNFTYGSGGTSFTAWVQTSLDAGGTWTDVANLAGTTSSIRKVYNLSALTPQTTAVSPADGSLSANTSQDGVFGTLWRVKYTTVGTYATATTLRIDMIPHYGRLTSSP